MTLPRFITSNNASVPTWLALAASEAAAAAAAPPASHPPADPPGASVLGAHLQSAGTSPLKRPRRPAGGGREWDDNAIVLTSSSSEDDEQKRRAKSRPRLHRANTGSSGGQTTHSRATSRSSCLPSSASRPPSTHLSTRTVSPMELSDEDDDLEIPPSSQPSSSQPSSSRGAVWPRGRSSFSAAAPSGSSAYYVTPLDGLSPLRSQSPYRTPSPVANDTRKGKGRM